MELGSEVLQEATRKVVSLSLRLFAKKRVLVTTRSSPALLSASLRLAAQGKATAAVAVAVAAPWIVRKNALLIVKLRKVRNIYS